MAEPKKSNKERLREITEGIEQGIKELFESDKYRQYLSTMSRFHRYSVNNVTLIHMQMPGATHVAGYNKWRDQFERHVKKGEHGITIIAPTPFKKKIEQQKLDPDTKAPMLDKDGKVITEEKEIEIPMFRPVKVFDVSQTEGKPLPQLASDLTGNVRQFEAFLEALRRSSPVPVSIEPLESSMDGYFSPEKQKIVVRSGMSEVQTVSAAVHEIAHAKLHNYEKEREAAAAGTQQEPPKKKDRQTEEVEAESISYTVCQYFGIQTGENSFGYIATWSSGKELPELRASLETIQKTSTGLINDIERNFKEICKERGIDLTGQPEPKKEPIETEKEQLCVLDDSVYLHIQATEDGWDYTLYDRETMQELDGGQLDRPDLPLSTAALEICQMHDMGAESIKLAPLELVETLQEAAIRQMQGEVEQREADQVQDISAQTVDAPIQTAVESEVTAEELAVAIDNFAYDYDTYEYGDRVEDREQAVAELLQIIQSDKVSSIREWLQEIAEEDEIPAIRIQAQELITKMDHFAGAEIRSDLAEAPISDAETASPSILPDAPEQALDEYPMPDEQLQAADLEACGYMDGDMLPLSREQAMELFDKELTVYAIVDGGSAEMLFDREEFEMQAPAKMFAVSREEWEQSSLFHDKIMERADRQQEREQAFLAYEADCFAIYQVSRDDPNNVRFMNMDWMQSHGLAIDRANYDLIYTAPLTATGSTLERLEALYEQFNLRHPADYHSPSLSVSDIVAVKQDGMVSCHYCDSVGFREIPGFLPQAPDNPLKNAEMSMEDDYGMIDGIINNGPREQPTVAQLEQQARSGQPISLMDLADAVHREEREKKRSVVEQLKTRPRQEKKKTAPKKSAEREI